ncbi:hypothetical protein C834K_0240 [Chlamydia poikilotherma]|uniref:Macro domain-containing protein n=1 Tax=Chlamydia poikilotherma TaxID=1967783 RepID=A0A3B0QFQ2_9CHLA|nr:hypothetical protein [Chlamydia poikilotherma]SYX08712.1 hypothetical protein C834K_0240 [Chlamydia poikilotherma]
MPSINSGDSHNRIGNRNAPNLTPAFSSREISTQKQNKILKVVSLSILGTLAVGTAVAGIALAVVLGSPVFAALAIASVLFAGIAILVHKQLTRNADGNWTQALDQNFRNLPTQTAEANFITTPGTRLSFYQNKKNPGVKLGIQEDITTGFSIKFSALPRSNTVRMVTSQSGMTFNALPPSSETVITANSNQSRAFFKELNSLGQHSNWNAAQYQGETSIKLPFAPTEVRSTTLSIKDNPNIPLSEKEKYPEFLGHVRGPKLEEFSGSDQEIMNGYYNRALFAYENCLNEAVNKDCSIVSVPLFSSVYEVNGRDVLPKGDQNYEWLLSCNDLCKKALVEAINNIALANPNSLKLLVLLQDPFAPLP